MIIKIGCCGYQKSKKEYFKNFSLVEIQSTFYQPPQKIETVKRWRESAPKDFEFTIKVWQIITHPPSSPTYRRLKEKFGKKENYGFFQPTKEVFLAWEKMKEIAKILSAKILIFQTPSSFEQKRENIKNMEEFFKEIKRDSFILGWEPRGNWQKEVVKKICQKLNLVHVVDPFKEKSLFGEINYFRLHGKGGYSYKYKKEDFKKLLKFCDKKINYVLFNNVYMFDDAKKFKTLVGKNE